MQNIDNYKLILKILMSTSFVLFFILFLDSSYKFHS